MFIAFLLFVTFGIVNDKTQSFLADSSKASFISATSGGALNGDVPGGWMNFSSLYLLCSIALITDVRRSFSFCVLTGFCSFLSWSRLVFQVLERLVVQLFDSMDLLWPNLTFGTDAGSGGPDGLPDP